MYNFTYVTKGDECPVTYISRHQTLFTVNDYKIMHFVSNFYSSKRDLKIKIRIVYYIRKNANFQFAI